MWLCLSFLILVVQSVDLGNVISKVTSSQFLKRKARAYNFFEETKPGNLERECIEEDCNYEECHEVTDEKSSGDALWKIITECKNQRGSGKTNVRKCVDLLQKPHWEEWTAWSTCSATCTNPRYSMPYRERMRTCTPGIVDNTYCITENSGKGERLGISVDGSEPQREEAQTKSCDDLVTCNMITADLSGRIQNGNAVFRATWTDTSGFDSNDFLLKWYLNSTAVARVPARGRPVLYHNSDIREYTQRIKIEADYTQSYSEFTFRGVTPADYDLAISVEIEWNQETRREVKTIREIGGQ